MHTDFHVALEIQAPLGENLLKKDGDSSVPSSSLMAVDNQKPDKKHTRQWAAWTRQEEENFFNALRQVGKNFEKITCHVQSKNKNQVRHYYYRLVRRMNKLLSPGFCLDAKNSKDTNAAMLRWWSLLEKYSCTASKLHLKPRRFKIFIEALENQLLKDRNKSKRKRSCQGENHVAAPSTSAPSKALGNNDRPLKLLLVNPQNNRKVGVNRGASLRRSMSVNISFSKEELPTMRTVREKRKPGLIASATFRRWEKEAMAGVALVADAAEQLERTTNDGNHSFHQGSSVILSNKTYTADGQKDVDHVGNSTFQLSSPTLLGMCSNKIRETVMPQPTKLKLQLFPVDEGTREALEKDACNPHLELTLSARKRVSSVLEHLNRKWGSLGIASGELMLLPYSAQREDIARNRRWTVKDTISCAADVYATIGSPTIFRLRYGWFSSAESLPDIVHVPSPVVHFDAGRQSEGVLNGFNVDVPNKIMIDADSPKPALPVDHAHELSVRGSSQNQLTTIRAPVSSFIDTPETIIGESSAESQDEHQASSEHTSASWSGGEKRNGHCRNRPEDVVNLGGKTRGTLSAGEWADSLTNISIGDLLSESTEADSRCVNFSLKKSAPCPQEMPFSSDSFDAAVAAHISAHELSRIPTQALPTSIWNAEETCDEFSFQMAPTLRGKGSDPSSSNYIGDCRQSAHPTSSGFQGYLKDLSKPAPSIDPCGDLDGEPKELSLNNESYDPAKNISLSDISWPDSLGPLDLDLPSSRYQGQDLVFGESISLGGLSKMVGSSLDAFQNCSFFGMDVKGSSSEAQGASILLDDKIDREDKCPLSKGV